MKKVIQILNKLFQKIQVKRTLFNSFYEVIITLIPKSDKDIATKEYYKQISVTNIDKKSSKQY